MGIIAALFGLAVGSFLNVCVDRLPNRKSILRPRSHCPACKTPLAARDMVPVLSYVHLRGRCRYCSAAIPKRVLLVEAGAGFLFLLLWIFYGASYYLLPSALAAAVLIVVLVVALECRASLELRRGSLQAGGGEVADDFRR